MGYFEKKFLCDYILLPLLDLPVKAISRPIEIESFDTDITETLGDKVSIVGFPLMMTSEYGLPLTMTGFIATDPMTNSIYFDARLPVIYIQAQSRPGSSGSPVFFSYTDGFVDNAGKYQGQVNKFKLIGINSGTAALGNTVQNYLEFMVVWKGANIKKLILYADSVIAKRLGHRFKTPVHRIN